MEWLRTSRTSKCSGRLPQNSGRSTCYGPKLAVADRRAGTSIIAGMMCGADCIGDADVLRAGGTPRVFDEVYAPSTVGIFLREFSFGHANQLAAVARAHLIALAARAPLLVG